MYNKVQHLKPHLDEFVPNRKFLIHNYIRGILKNHTAPVQILSLACGWDPILVKMSEEFPQHSFFGVDNESVQIQKDLIHKIMPQSKIFYLKTNITDSKKLAQKLTDEGWKSDQPSCIILEGIIYYIPSKILWDSLKKFRQNIQADCFLCGDFLIDWKEQNISSLSQNLGEGIFNMIKSTCSQNYYPITTKQIQTNLENISFSNIQFFTQSEIQKQRKGQIHPWKENEGHVCLFTAESRQTEKQISLKKCRF